MATIAIPTKTDGTQHYTLRTTLGGNAYGFEFFWNARDLSWSFILSDSTGGAIVQRKVTLGSFMLLKFADPRLPAGELYAIDTSNQNLDAGLTDLGGRVQLVFTDAADIVALIT